MIALLVWLAFGIGQGPSLPAAPPPPDPIVVRITNHHDQVVSEVIALTQKMALDDAALWLNFVEPGDRLEIFHAGSLVVKAEARADEAPEQEPEAANKI